MTDLVAFLNARLDEDETLACAALKPDEMHPYGDSTLPRITPEQVPDAVRNYLGGTWGEHFACHDPARVLADVTAKRAIIALDDSPRAREDWYGKALDDVMRLLAQPYAEHPDFNPAWRIEVSPDQSGEPHV